MSHHKDIYTASYLNPNEASKHLEGLGYKYDHELSSPESKVFTDKEGKPHIAFRGSQRVKDDWLGADIKLMLGLENMTVDFGKQNIPRNWWKINMGVVLMFLAIHLLEISQRKVVLVDTSIPIIKQLVFLILVEPLDITKRILVRRMILLVYYHLHKNTRTN